MDGKLIKYIVESERDSLWGLTVSTVGFENNKANTPYPSLEHPSNYYYQPENGRVLTDYQLVYVTDGEGELLTQSIEKTPIRAGNIFVLFPGEWHTYKPNPKTGWKQYWIGFCGVNMDKRVLHGFLKKENPIFNVGVNEEIVDLYRRAIKVAKEERTAYQQLLAGIVNHLLGLMYSLHRDLSFEDKEAVKQINKAKVIMRERIESYIYISQLAQEVGMSDSMFRRTFKEYVGMSPSSYFQEIKLGRAKELLVTTFMSIKEVAYTLGFEDPNYFSACFKKSIGTQPNEFRQQYRIDSE